MVVIHLTEPPWQEFVLRSNPVTAFQWFKDLGDCIPEIKKMDGDFFLPDVFSDTEYTLLYDGCWVVQNRLGKTWMLSNAEMDRHYQPKEGSSDNE
jgi:hypothetical protein